MSKGDKGITQVWNEYQNGKDYNIKLNIYDDTDKNERFYAGDQWNGLKAPNMPQPVFNIFKRVINYFIAAILQQPARISAFPLLSSEDGSEDEQLINEAADLISAYMETIWERMKMDNKARQLLLDAAISGDMSTYMYWNPNIETAQDSKGDIDIELLDGVNVYYGNPNEVDTQKQPYIIIAFRELVDKLQKEAKANKVPKKDYEKITSDADNLYTAGDRGKVEIDVGGKQNGKTTALLKFWKEDGVVMAEKSTQHVTVRPKWDTKLTRYPNAWNNWDKRKNSYHGQALGTGIVPNQIYINQQFALVMVAMRDIGFPKVLFDKAALGGWSNKVGGAYGVNTDGRPLGSFAQYMTPSQINAQMLQTIDLAINYTKEFLGANDAALGDLNADNARALAIVTEQAAVPLANIKSNLYQMIEDMGYIMLDFMANYYGKRKVTVMEKGKRVVKEFDFDKLKKLNLRLKVEVSPSSLYSELAGQETLDNLLSTDRITFLQWLDRTRTGLVPKKQELMEEMKEQQELAEQLEQTPQETPEQPQEQGFTEQDFEAMEQFLSTLPPEVQQQILALPEGEQEQAIIQLMNQGGA